MANQLTRLITGNLFKSEKEGKGGALTTMPQPGAGVPTPENPGQIVPCQSAPIVTKPTYFSPLVAKAISQYAESRKDRVKSTAAAYKSLSEIVTADTQVLGIHSTYQKHVATKGKEQVGMQADVLTHLNGLRPEYEEIKAGLNFANQAAERQVNEVLVDLEIATGFLAA